MCLVYFSVSCHFVHWNCSIENVTRRVVFTSSATLKETTKTTKKRVDGDQKIFKLCVNVYTWPTQTALTASYSISITIKRYNENLVVTISTRNEWGRDTAKNVAHNSTTCSRLICEYFYRIVIETTVFPVHFTRWKWLTF